MKDKVDLTPYMDANAPLHTPRRFSDCPFCKERVSSKGFVVTRSESGFLMWCHKCHTKRFIKNGVPSFRQCVKNLRDRKKLQPHECEASTAVTKVIVLPEDYTTEIPNTGLAWLALYNVTPEEQARYRFGYSPSLDRLIIPVYTENGDLCFWQGRRLSSDSSRPKYLNISLGRTDIKFYINNNSPTTVVVEDVLSALAVARAGYNSVSLLGSYVNDSIVEFLVRLGTRCVVWLDPDKRRESLCVTKRLRGLGLQSVSLVLPDKDPKDYTPDEVRTYVK